MAPGLRDPPAERQPCPHSVWAELPVPVRQRGVGPLSGRERGVLPPPASNRRAGAGRDLKSLLAIRCEARQARRPPDRSMGPMSVTSLEFSTVLDDRRISYAMRDTSGPVMDPE